MLRLCMEKIKSFIIRCEESNIGFGLWICTALAIIYIRDSIESLVSTGSFPAVDLFHFLHVPTFFISLLLAIIILLHFFTRTEIIKVSKICLIFFTIIILPVTIDFLTSLVVKRDIVYQYIDENVPQNFINFFNPLFKIPEIPYSLRIEIAVITILSFIYIFLKRNKIFSSLLGAFLVFALCVFYGSIPGILTGGFILFLRALIFVFRFIHPRLDSGKLGGMLDEGVVVIIELLFTLSMVVIWFLRYDIKKFKALLKNLRFTRCFHYIIMVLMGIALYFYDVRERDLFILVRIIGMFCAIFFACQFSAVVNDIFDIDCDRISNKDRPLIIGVLGTNEYLKVGIVYLAFALLFAILVSDSCFIITLVFIALYFIYSVPPFRLKKFFPISSMIIGIQALLALLLGRLSLEKEGTEVSIYPSIAWLMFLVFLLSSNIKDLKDIEGDRHCKFYTLPVIFGEVKARKIIACLVLLSYLIVPVFLYLLFYSHIITIFSLLFGLANYLYIRRQNAQERVIFGIYFIYAFMIILFFLKNIFY